MHLLDRRQFLLDTAAAALAGLCVTENDFGLQKLAASHPHGSANERLHVAVIGVRGRGLDHIAGLAHRHNCLVTTICDADQSVIGQAMRMVEDRQGKAPQFVRDLRRVMDDKSIDIVTIATPNHWHALAAVWALQAGKDVYVEKPVSHNVSEGRRIVEATRKYQRICQAGMQSRSSSGMQAAMKFLHEGKLGKIKLARGVCYKLRPGIGKARGSQPIPQSIDYDLWCGPAPQKPLLRKRLHYDWHWFWDYGNGDLGNQGIHEMDKARWGLGKNGLASTVVSVGGRFGYKDDGETANTQICVLDYGDCELIFEVRGLPSVSPYPAAMDGKKGSNFIGNIFYGSEGVLVCPNYTTGVALTPKGEVIQRFQGDGDHYGNFIKAVRSRKTEDLTADILEGHLSSALCHLGNISYRLGNKIPLQQKTKAFEEDKYASETLARMQEHLKENRVALQSTPYQVGRKLVLDAKTETFVDDPKANTYLTRQYRAPFIVPPKV